MIAIIEAGVIAPQKGQVGVIALLRGALPQTETRKEVVVGTAMAHLMVLKFISQSSRYVAICAHV